MKVHNLTVTGSLTSGGEVITSISSSTVTKLGSLSSSLSTSIGSLSSSMASSMTSLSSSLTSSMGSLSSSMASTMTSLSSSLTGSMGSLSSSMVTSMNNLSSSMGSIMATTGSNLFKGDQTISGSIIPSVNNTYDLGSPTQQFRHVYISSGSLYVNGTKVLGSTAQELQITTDAGQSFKILEAGSDTITLQAADGNITLAASGGGDVILDPTSGVIALKGTTTLYAGNKILSSDGNAIQIGNSVTMTGSLIVTGFIETQELRTTYISSSILYRSGSTKFGDELTDTHAFSGSVLISGSISVPGSGLISGSSQITYSGLSGVPSGIISGSSQLPSGLVSGSVQVLNGSGVFSGSAQLPSGIVSSSAQTIANLPSGIVSSSAQTIANLPSGVVSGSSQVLAGTTIHSGSFFNGISVVSGSVQVDVMSTTNIARLATTGSNTFTSNQTITNGGRPYFIANTTNAGEEAGIKIQQSTVSDWYIGTAQGTPSPQDIAIRDVKNGRIPLYFLASTGAAVLSSSVTASSFVKSGGTSSQYLMADGSVSSNSNLFLSGGIMTGQITWSGGVAALSFQQGGNTGTYTQTTIYANQNNTSGDIANGIFIERGYTDTSNTELRQFVIGARGGSYQWKLSGPGGTFQRDTCEVKPSGDGDLFVGRYSGGAAKLFRAYQASADGYLELATGAGTVITKLSGYSGTANYTSALFGFGKTTGISYYIDAYSGGGQVARFTTNQTGTNIGQCAEFINSSPSGYASWIYIGSAPGTDWKIGKNISNSANTTYHFEIVDSSNNLRMQINNGTGNVTFSGSVTQNSDIRLKKNVRDIDGALNKILQTRGVLYDRIDTTATDEFGFIAQELETILPELVTTSDLNLKSVKYQNLTPILVEAIKELKAEIDLLKKAI